MSSGSGSDLVGRSIDGRYEILRRLGSGAMGEVYAARQVGLDVIRAVKIIQAELLDTSQAVARFRREALVMGRLGHEHIAQVLELGRLPWGGLFMAMELVDGPDTQSLVMERGTFGLTDGLELLSRVTSGLDYAHREGVVHRDLKPANVILAGADPTRPKIVDFGLAKLIHAEGITKLTVDQQILGTPLYMSPEQCNALEVGAPADVYALAGLAYFYLSGSPVFSASILTALILAHTYTAPEPLSKRLPHLGIPPLLDDLLLRCLAKEPSERPASAEVYEGLVEALRLVRTGRAGEVGDTLAYRSGSHQVSESGMALATAIWGNQGRSSENSSADLGRGDGADDGMLRIQDAIVNQITAVVSELAMALPPGPFDLRSRLARVGEIEAAIEALELDLALLDSQMGDAGAPESAQAEVAPARARLGERAGHLRQQLDVEHRAIFHGVHLLRREVTDPGILNLYGELDGLMGRLMPMLGERIRREP